MAVLVTNDKWVLQPGGVLDIVDEQVALAASTDGTLVKANLKQGLEMMQKDDPARYEH